MAPASSVRALLALLACLAAPAARAQNAPLLTPEASIPPGFGTLRQDDIQLVLRTPTLEIRFLPIDPRTGNLLAPDAYTSFRKLFLENRSRIDSVARMRGASQPGVAFVTFFGLAPGAFYDSEVLTLVIRNRLVRPTGLVPYTPGFLEQRLAPRESKSAFIVYEEAIPVLEPFQLQYQAQFTSDWTGKLSRINAERQRVALRAAKAPARDTLVPAPQ
ncbi:MAG: hypothetical protein MUC69_05770 [Gemmatimonadales bacterium]|jgi:hypothetical protein|nr:hypothetical protein [Gemmatimonadales bacterium]